MNCDIAPHTIFIKRNTSTGYILKFLAENPISR